jgi:hypothetical protein
MSLLGVHGSGLRVRIIFQGSGSYGLGFRVHDYSLGFGLFMV